MLNWWLWREQRSRCTSTAVCAESSPQPARANRAHHPGWLFKAVVSAGRSRGERSGAGGNGREVSKWADMGFKCCLDAKVILLSEEPCGFISCSLAELILAMLK